MENKPIYKSLTINSLIVVLAILLLRSFGVVDVEMGKTYDTVDTPSHTSAVRTTEIISAIAVGSAAYGRIRARGGVQFRKGNKK